MNYEKTIEQIKLHEGLRLKPYKCTEGYLTIGYGRNLETNGISQDEAEEMLLNDISKVEQKIQDAGLFFGCDARKAVLLNMAFQIGFSGLMKFKNMIAAYRNGEYFRAAEEMLNSKWATQTPRRAKELAEQMRTGEFQ